MPSPSERYAAALARGAVGRSELGAFAAGYLFGPGDSMQRLAPYEFCRIRNISAQDRAEVFHLPR